MVPTGVSGLGKIFGSPRPPSDGTQETCGGLCCSPQHDGGDPGVILQPLSASPVLLLLLLLTEAKAGRDGDPSDSAPHHKAVWNVLGRVTRGPSAVDV